MASIRKDIKPVTKNIGLMKANVRWAILPITPSELTRNMDKASPLVKWLNRVSLFPSRSMLTAMPGAIKMSPAKPNLSHGQSSNQVVQGRKYNKSQGIVRLKNIPRLYLCIILNNVPI